MSTRRNKRASVQKVLSASLSGKIPLYSLVRSLFDLEEGIYYYLPTFQMLEYRDRVKNKYLTLLIQKEIVNEIISLFDLEPSKAY